MSKRYTFYLKTKEGTYKFRSTLARDGFTERNNIKKGACYYKDNETGEMVWQYCFFNEEYDTPEKRQKAFDEYFKDILSDLEV